jgi:hypothetical protein
MSGTSRPLASYLPDGVSITKMGIFQEDSVWEIDQKAGGK